MSLTSRLTFAILLSASVAAGCSGDGSTNPTGTAGTGGGTAGTSGGGGTGGGGGGTGGSGLPFMAVEPCNDEGAYVTGSPVTFPSNGLAYAPKCLKVTAGGSVTFNGEFGSHPMAASTRGSTPSPFPAFPGMSTGTTASFTFTTPGFYPYWCTFHGSDSGTYMSGVVWAQ